MTLEKLLEDVEYEMVQGDVSVDVADVAYDSRRVVRSGLFVAISGTVSDGHKFILDVIQKDVSAIVVEKDISDICKLCKLPDGIPDDITVIKVVNARRALSLISKNFFDHPLKKMKSIGITGTKGKSTTTYLVQSILKKAGIKCGIIGTIGVVIDDKVTPIEHTTPESYELQKYFSDMVDAGCDYVVMEVSSQAVKMDRVAGLFFDIGVFTNITPDHIGPNEHADFDEYLSCKSALFSMCEKGVYNADDPHTGGIIDGATCESVTYGIEVDECDIKASDIEHMNMGDKLSMSFHTEGLIKADVTVGLPGLFNVYNALCAMTIGVTAGVGKSHIVTAMEDVYVSGRVENVPTGRDFSVLIDFAHNGISTQSVLETLRGYEPHRLIAIFGCGGNRSKLRRYEMGEAVGKFADFAVVTSDNPRMEKFGDIVEDIRVGLAKTDGEYVIIEDRYEAVAYAIDHAETGDMIVLLGKGHEQYQEINGIKHHYSEKEAVERALHR